MAPLHPARFRRCSRGWCLGIVCLLLSACNSAAEDSLQVVDSLTYGEPKEYHFGLLFEIGGCLGSYQNLSDQRGDSVSGSNVSRGSNGPYAEVGLCVNSLCLTSFVEGMGHHRPHECAGRNRWGGRTFYRIEHRRFHLIPEIGWVFWEEELETSSAQAEGPGAFRKELKDDGFSCGLAARVRVRKVTREDSEGGWCLYARYVHDNIDVKADNYWMLLEIFVKTHQPQRLKKDDPPSLWRFFRLGARWTMRTDGRSERYLIVEFGNVFGLF